MNKLLWSLLLAPKQRNSILYTDYIVCLQRIVVKIPSHWSRILYKWLCVRYWSLFCDPQLLHQLYRELAALSPEPIFDDYWTVNCRAHKNWPILSWKGWATNYPSWQWVTVFLSLNDKPPFFWWTNGKWERSLSLNEEINLAYIQWLAENRLLPTLNSDLKMNINTAELSTPIDYNRI